MTTPMPKASATASTRTGTARSRPPRRCAARRPRARQERCQPDGHRREHDVEGDGESELDARGQQRVEVKRHRHSPCARRVRHRKRRRGGRSRELPSSWPRRPGGQTRGREASPQAMYWPPLALTRGAGDEAGLVAGEEDHAAGDLLGLAEAPDRDLRQDLGLQHLLRAPRGPSRCRCSPGRCS